MFPKVLTSIQVGSISGTLERPTEDSNGYVWLDTSGLVQTNFGASDSLVYEYYNGTTWNSYTPGSATNYVANSALRVRAYNSLYDVYTSYITSATNTAARVGGEAGLVSTINAANTGGWGTSGASVVGNTYSITFTNVPVGLRTNYNMEAFFSQNFTSPTGTFFGTGSGNPGGTSSVAMSAVIASIGTRSGACTVLLYIPYAFPDGVSGSVNLTSGSIP